MLFYRSKFTLKVEIVSGRDKRIWDKYSISFDPSTMTGSCIFWHTTSSATFQPCCATLSTLEKKRKKKNRKLKPTIKTTNIGYTFIRNEIYNRRERKKISHVDLHNELQQITDKYK